MVLMLDGILENFAQPEGKLIFSEKKKRFVTALDLIKYLKQIK